MRSRRVGIACAAYEPDHVTAVHDQPFGNPVRVTIQMSVVIAIFLRRVKLVNGVSARLAQKQLHDFSIIHREDGRSARRHDIRCFMPFSASPWTSSNVSCKSDADRPCRGKERWSGASEERLSLVGAAATAGGLSRSIFPWGACAGRGSCTNSVGLLWRPK